MEQPQDNDVITKALEALIEGYFPALDITEAEVFLTTEEIIDAVANHTGHVPTPDQVLSFMEENGFSYARRGKADLFFILKNK